MGRVDKIHLSFVENTATGDMLIDKSSPEPFVGSAEFVRAGHHPHPFQALKEAIHADPEYAWAWHCNLAVPFMDAANAGHVEANLGAALIMAQMFDYDITTHPHANFGKSDAQAYFERRVQAEREEDEEAARQTPSPSEKGVG